MIDNELFANKMKENSSNHDSLFHYTSIDSLYQILTNKSFKFTRLDLLNDLSEKKRNSESEIDFFTLSFSNHIFESIPMWYMYTNQCSGVCLKLKNINLFENSNAYYFNDNGKIYFEDKIISSSGKPTKLIEVTNGYIELSEPQILDVIYSDYEINRKFKDILELPGYSFESIIPAILVGVKGEAWSYESETRYYISATTLNRIDIKQIFYEFVDTVIDGFEIIFNPFMNTTDKDEIKTKIKYLLPDEQYSKIVFTNSELENKINPTFMKRLGYGI
jgi:hypothetical protein